MLTYFKERQISIADNIISLFECNTMFELMCMIFPHYFNKYGLDIEDVFEFMGLPSLCTMYNLDFFDKPHCDLQKSHVHISFL